MSEPRLLLGRNRTGTTKQEADRHDLPGGPFKEPADCHIVDHDSISNRSGTCREHDVCYVRTKPVRSPEVVSPGKIQKFCR
ncbi:MAG: hypothetical protein QOH42_370 [Blastocatellia bacterium]|nr:hypothetical protein [Blastocatellia bacterium]